jgi:hypothetical protein
MYEIFALRSLPWHALQRRLANSISDDHASIASWLTMAASARLLPAGSAGQSWLTRALTGSRPG